MKYHYLLSLAFFFQTELAYSQLNGEKRTLQAVRTEESIRIDGILDEAVWQQADAATDFTQFQFQWKVPSAYKSEVKIDHTCIRFRCLWFASFFYTISCKCLQEIFT